MRKMHVPVQVYLTTANQSEICAVYFIFGKFLPETRCVSELLAVELTALSFFWFVFMRFGVHLTCFGIFRIAVMRFWGYVWLILRFYDMRSMSGPDGCPAGKQWAGLCGGYLYILVSYPGQFLCDHHLLWYRRIHITGDHEGLKNSDFPVSIRLLYHTKQTLRNPSG